MKSSGIGIVAGLALAAGTAMARVPTVPQSIERCEFEAQVNGNILGVFARLVRVAPGAAPDCTAWIGRSFEETNVIDAQGGQVTLEPGVTLRVRITNRRNVPMLMVEP